jgi:hypothetical protein
MRKLILVLIPAALWGCKNIDDATPSDRNTFIRAYEGPLSYAAADVQRTSDGYIILGTMPIQDDSVVTVVIKTDKAVNPVSKPGYFGKGIGKAIKPFSNSVFSGYIIVGDSIKINPTAAQGGNIEISSMQLLFIDENLKEVGSYAVSDNTASLIKTDIKGSALTITGDGRVIVLGTYEESGQPQKPFIVALDKNLKLQWSDLYSALDLNYFNGKSVHYSNGNIIWASSIVSEQGNFSDAYITVPFIKEPLAFDNYSLLGENKKKAFFVNDIQPANAVGFGYGIVGTFGDRDRTRKNVFFTRVSASGTIIKEDTLFIDGIRGSTLSTQSEIEDTGDAICSSSLGGFILAGTITTITGQKGNGARDVQLIKINAFGDIEWITTIGGIGDETVSAVIETEDKGILVCGTNTIGNYSTIFIIKTNSKGELIN